MITIRKSEERGTARHGWLTSHHTFSFANYYDPQHMGFRTLRVINEDTVAPGRGFGAHRHEDMEIVSIVMSGALTHKDNTGSEGVLRRGEVQRMSAGTGVVHSESNGSNSEPVHFFQIWIEPATESTAPGYEQKLFSDAERTGALRLVVSPEGAEGSLRIGQDAKIYSGILRQGDRVEHVLESGRAGWVQVARGSISVNGVTADAGDGIALEDESSIIVEAGGDAEVLVFDLA